MATVIYDSSMGEPPLNQPFYGANPIQAISRFFRKYATFSGRASRSEFWWPVFILNVVSTLVGLLAQQVPQRSVWIVYAISSLFSLACLIPFLAVATRRLHDTNRSGKLLWLFIGGNILIAIAMIGLFVSFVYTTSHHSTGNDRSTNSFIYVLILLFFVAATVYFILTILFIVYMTRESDPRGVRFDTQANNNFVRPASYVYPRLARPTPYTPTPQPFAPQGGYAQGVPAQNGYAPSGYGQTGYGQTGYPQGAYPAQAQQGYQQAVYPQTGYAQQAGYTQQPPVQPAPPQPYAQTPAQPAQFAQPVQPTQPTSRAQPVQPAYPAQTYSQQVQPSPAVTPDTAQVPATPSATVPAASPVEASPVENSPVENSPLAPTQDNASSEEASSPSEPTLEQKLKEADERNF